MAERILPTVDEVRTRVGEIRGNLKTKIEEWKERGWKPAGGTQKEPLFPRVRDRLETIREKGVLSQMRARSRSGSRAGRGVRAEEIEPAFPKARAVREEAEITPTVGKREIAIEI